jgi:hypothetical protein
MGFYEVLLVTRFIHIHQSPTIICEEPLNKIFEVSIINTQLFIWYGLLRNDNPLTEGDVADKCVNIITCEYAT